jgi:hypothetical protein
MDLSSEFRSLSLKQKHHRLLTKAEFIASRIHGGYQVHLFTLEGNYVEVWKSIGLNYIHWIEIVQSQRTLENYVVDLDLNLN